MDTTEIIQGNRIIAEFMGLQYDDHDEKWHDGKYFATDSLLYNTDWSRLMPVVEKIESVGHSTTISSDVREAITDKYCCEILHKGALVSNLFYKNSKTKIEAVWLAVIEFIKWYNQSK